MPKCKYILYRRSGLQTSFLFMFTRSDQPQKTTKIFRSLSFRGILMYARNLLFYNCRYLPCYEETNKLNETWKRISFLDIPEIFRNLLNFWLLFDSFPRNTLLGNLLTVFISLTKKSFLVLLEEWSIYHPVYQYIMRELIVLWSCRHPIPRRSLYVRTEQLHWR